MDPISTDQAGRYRDLLQALARQVRLDPRWQRRFDTSDLVQEALLKACQHADQFRGGSEAELAGWLREILRHTLADALRQARADKRDLDRERDVSRWLEESSARLEALGREPSPSEPLRGEELRLQVAQALARLPADQGDVVVLRDLVGTPVADIARQLGRTEKAVAGLLLRGRRKLRALLHEEG